MVLALIMLNIACKEKKSDTPVEEEVPGMSVINERIAADPSNADLYFARAQAWLDVEKPRQAVTDLHKALELDSVNLLYYQSLSDLYVDLGEKDRAVETLEAGLHFLPTDIDLRLQLGRLLIAVKDFGMAEKVFLEALNIDEQNPDAWFYRSLVAEGSGDTIKAIRFLKRTIEQDPEHFEAYSKLGVIHTSLKDPLALLYFDNALRVRPGDVQTLLNKGHYHRKLRDFPKAIAAYREVVLAEPQNEQVHKNIAYVYLEMDSLDKAYRFFDRAVKFEPANANNYFGRAVVAEKRAARNTQIDSVKADLYRAKQDYENVLGLNSEDVEAYRRLQLINEQLKEFN